jgi:hypothetical protein
MCAMSNFIVNRADEIYYIFNDAYTLISLYFYPTSTSAQLQSMILQSKLSFYSFLLGTIITLFCTCILYHVYLYYKQYIARHKFQKDKSGYLGRHMYQSIPEDEYDDDDDSR